MSIRKIHKLTEKGCGTILGVGLLVIMAFGFLLNGPGKGLGMLQQKKDQSDAQVMAMVGTTVASPLLVDRSESKDLADKTQALREAGTRMYIVELSSYDAAISNAIALAKIVEFAKSKGIVLNDKDVEQGAISQVVGLVQQRRQLIVQQGMVKSGASAEEIENAYKSIFRESSDDTQTRMLADVKETLDSPDLRLQAVASAAMPLLMQQYEKKVTVTDEDVQAHFKSFDLKRVVLGKGPDAKKNADKAEAALKGGMKFEDAIKAFTTEKASVGKSLTDSTMPVTGDTTVAYPKRAPLLKMKEGDVSGILEGPDGFEIVKVTAIRTTKPTNDAEVRSYRQGLLEHSAADLLQKDIDAQGDKNVVWKIEGYKLVPELQKAKAANNLDAIKKTYEAAKNAVTEQQGMIVASLVMLGAAEEIYNRSSEVDKPKFRKELIAANEQYLQSHENQAQRLELAELQIDEKNSKEAANQLQQAARENLDTDAMAGIAHAQIANLLTRLKALGGLDPAAEKQISDEQARWQKDLADKTAAEAKIKADMEADRKRSEAEAKRQKDAAAKASAGGTTPNTAPAPKKP